MKKWKRRLLRIGGAIGIVLILLFTAAILALNSKAFRQQMARQATVLLAEKLETHVAVKDADFDVLRGRIRLHGVDIEDRQGRKMLLLDQLVVQTELWPLLFNEVRINDARIRGLHAHLLKPATKEPANYQFVVDAFKRKKTTRKQKIKLELNIEKLLVEDNSITYNDNYFSLKRIFYRKGQTGRLENAQTTFVTNTKKGKRTHQLRVERIAFSDDVATRRLLNIRGIHYTSDSIRAKADLQMRFQHLDIDSLNASITNLQIAEEKSGFRLSDMTLTAKANKQMADIGNLVCRIKGNKSFASGIVALKRAHYEKGEGLEARHLKASWTAKEKKGDASHQAVVEEISVTPHDNGQLLTLKGIGYEHNSHKPRKNKTGIPDMGHLMLKGDLQIALEQPAPGTTQVALNECDLTETHSGMHVTDMQLALTHNSQQTKVDSLRVTLENPLTRLSGTVQLAKMRYEKNQEGTIEDLKMQWQTPNAKGYNTRNQAQIRKIGLQNLDNHLRLNLDGLRYATESQQSTASKNGYPNPQHLDVTAHLHALLDKNTQEDITLTIVDGQATDRISGMQMKDLHFNVRMNKERAQVNRLSANWVTHSDKGTIDNHLSMADILVRNLNTKPRISLKGVRYANNNHQPRKKTNGTPPAPDAGHLDITANLDLTLNNFSKDELDIVVNHLHAKEKGSGMNVSDLQLTLRSTPQGPSVNGVKGSFNWGDLAATFQTDLRASKDKNSMEATNLHARLTDHAKNTHAECRVDRLLLNKDQTGNASNLQVNWNSMTKKGVIDNQVSIASLSLKQRKADKLLEIGGVRFVTDGHKPRKNTGKPKRGFFDATHLDIHSDMTFSVKEMGKDGVKLSLTKCHVDDEMAGIHVKELLFDADIRKGEADLQNIRFRLPDSQMHIADAHFQFPDKRKGLPLHFETGQVEGTVVLKDISRTFAPILKGFTLPLHVSTRVSGTGDDMHFYNIVANTLDDQLKIYASGGITEMNNKFAMIVRFDVDSMYARGNSTEKIINLFPVKKLMMSQVEALGDISYKGFFRVSWKKEEFRGRLLSSVGPIDFGFGLDEKNKYLKGNFMTDSLKFGEAFGVKSVNFMACKGNFQVDIAKARTAAMRNMRNGKLPIGVAQVDVIEARYRFLHTKNLHANISSDGAVAKGRIEGNGKYIDLIGKFAFMQTGTKSKVKFRPGIRLHRRHETYQMQREQLEQQLKANVAPISYVYRNRYEIPSLFRH